MAGHGSKDYTWDVGSIYTDTPFSLVTPPPAGAAHGKRPCGGAPRRPAGEARCQVEGCSAPLAGAKEYHRRHKVCGAHAKAPAAVVRGLQQRFCQQCSRFHMLSAFDDTKRSCRRRLAGHNERRRKGSGGLASLDGAAADGTSFLYGPSSIFPGRALSLLSDEAPVWIPADFSQQSSSALLELMVSSRAAQLPAGDVAAGYQSSYLHTVQELLPASSGFTQLGDEWDQAHPCITLDLMQVSGSPYELLSSRKSQAREEQRGEIWESLGKTRFV